MTQTLLASALSLPTEERAELAERLWESLPNDRLDDVFAEQLAAEISARRARYSKGESRLHDWSVVKRDLNAIIDKAESR